MRNNLIGGNMKIAFVTIMILSLQLVFISTALGSDENSFGFEAKQPTPTWVKQFSGLELVLDSSINGNPILSFDNPEGNLILALKGQLFPLAAPELVTVHDTNLSDDSFVLAFHSENFGDGSLVFYGEKDSAAVTENNIKNALTFITVSKAVEKYRVKTDSNLIHFVGSNHCSTIDPGTPFSDLDSAFLAGHEQCPACFGNSSRNPDLAKELEIGRYLAAEIRSKYQVLGEGPRWQALNETGQEILAQWPMPSLGFKYRFNVIISDLPIAVGCPGGEIFVSQALLSLCENKYEKEAVLAHEISHVELRHGIRAYQSAKSDALVAGIVVGAAVGFGGKNAASGALVGGGLAYALSASAESLLFAGYPSKYVLEADATTRMYLKNVHGENGKGAFISVLNKIDSLENCTKRKIHLNAESRESRPNAKRLAFASGGTVVSYNPPVEFSLTKDGKVVGVFSVFGATVFDWYNPMSDENLDENEYFSSKGVEYYSAEMRFFARVTTTGAVGLNTELKDVEFKIGEQWYGADNKEDTIMEPNQSTRISLEKSFTSSNPIKSLSSLEIQGLKISGFDAVLKEGR